MTADTKPGNAPPWVPTALLTITGFVAGGWFTSALCYWQGVTFHAGGRLEHVLSNWQPDLAPGYVLSLAIAIIWIVLWFLHARSMWRRGHRLFHAVVPAVMFVFSAVVVSASAMACGGY